MALEPISRTLRSLLRSVRHQAPHDELAADSDIIDVLGLDSLDVGNFVVEIENAFGVRLGPDGIASLNTIDKLARFVASSPSSPTETSEDGASTP